VDARWPKTKPNREPLYPKPIMGLKHLLKEGTFKVTGRLRIEQPEEPFFGPGRLQLLELIDEKGSINQAAKAMGMSYSKAWKMINSLHEQALHPLVATQTGGEKGGGAIITPEAKEIIAYFKDLQTRFELFLQQETKKLGD
jgi:molybdate transport system regulatory protein